MSKGKRQTPQPVVTFPRPCCHYCDGFRLKRLTSHEDHRSGMITRRVECQECKQRFVLVLEGKRPSDE